MKPAARIEKDLLNLSASERLRFAIAAWDSLEGDAALMADPAVDPAGIALADERDHEIESGKSQALTDADFRHRTGGKSG